MGLMVINLILWFLGVFVLVLAAVAGILGIRALRKYLKFRLLSAHNNKDCARRRNPRCQSLFHQR